MLDTYHSVNSTNRVTRHLLLSLSKKSSIQSDEINSNVKVEIRSSYQAKVNHTCILFTKGIS